MKRSIYDHLLSWKNRPQHKPLILRGARQVGKTHVIRQLSNEFTNFIEINFEITPSTKQFFAEDLSIPRIIKNLQLFSGQEIVAGKTLLFFDEIQEAPNAIKALRYFFEEIPDLHIIAAGSLIDFALDDIGIPVGRVEFLHMYPMSFIEFLSATQNELLAQEILQHHATEALADPIHNKIIRSLEVYMAVGGMPEAVQSWINNEDLNACNNIHHQLINAYRQDFLKYANKFQIKYINLIFDRIPLYLGHQLKYSNIAKEYRKRELLPCLELLAKANVIHQVVHSAGHGLPLGAEANLDKFKVIFLDVALSQAVLGLDTKQWILGLSQPFINKGEIAEAFIGQELIAYSNPSIPANLYYWQNEARSSHAEIDYLTQKNAQIIPIEVKSKEGRSLKSMRIFLQSHSQSPYGVRFSTHNYSVFDGIQSYPLYAVASFINQQ